MVPWRPTVIIDHLTSLGVTAIELRPACHHSANDSTLLERGLTTYWGYNTFRTSRHPK